MVLILLAGSSLALLYSHGALLFEQRSAAQHTRATLALHAAEAGRDWAVALLNRAGPIDANCAPAAGSPAPGGGAAARNLRERYLDTDPATGLTGPALSARPGCVHSGTAESATWSCACPDSGDAALTAPDPSEIGGDHPAFTVRFVRGTLPGGLRLEVTGCSAVAADCGGAGAPQGRVELRQTLQAQGALLQLPAAALVSAGPAAVAGGVTLVNSEAASGGVALQAGAAVSLDPLAHIVGPPGRPSQDGIVANDTSLGPGEVVLLRRLFGLAPATLAALPGWKHLSCAGGCNADQVSAALADGSRALWLDGALTATGAVVWGSESRPLMLRVDGPLNLSGAFQFYGLVLADSFTWQQPGSGSARLRGAVVSFGSSSLGGAVELVRDSAILQRLRNLSGLYLPVPGSWQDFENR